MEEIFKRRSIRNYTSENVSDEDIKKLLKAGMAAPSAGNEQPWHFIIIKARETLDQIPSFHPHSRMVRKAPSAILICCDMNKVRHGEFWIQDCSAATENILLMATSKGLGAVWLGVYPVEERINGLVNLLDISANIVPFSLVPVGYPAEEIKSEERYDESIIHYDRW